MSTSREDAVLIGEARLFLGELVTRGVPLQHLLNHGTFPPGWPERYLSFIERVAHRYGDEEPLPREVVAVIYNASVYCTKRYHDWQRLTRGANQVTEDLVNQVRWAGDRVVLGLYWRALCPACGYDLRATPDRCPECGAAPAAPPA